MSDQPSRAPNFPLDVVHQEAEDAFVVLGPLINAAGRQLEGEAEAQPGSQLHPGNANTHQTQVVDGEAVFSQHHLLPKHCRVVVAEQAQRTH